MVETWSSIILNVIIIFLLLSGSFFVYSASLGIIRFPDVYTRLHAATKASTLGISSILIASFLFLFGTHGIVSGKLLLAIFFVLLTAPVSGHMLSRAAHRNGVKPFTKHRTDAYADEKKRLGEN